MAGASANLLLRHDRDAIVGPLPATLFVQTDRPSSSSAPLKANLWATRRTRYAVSAEMHPRFVAFARTVAPAPMSPYDSGGLCAQPKSASSRLSLFGRPGQHHGR
jgi:hypothetical protein